MTQEELIAEYKRLHLSGVGWEDPRLQAIAAQLTPGSVFILFAWLLEQVVVEAESKLN